MFSVKKTVADGLFATQILLALVFGGAQFVRMLTTAQGVSISWFLAWEVFLAINLVLALNAHRVRPSRVTWQTIGSYAVWVTIVTLDLGVMIVCGTGTWNELDTATIMIIVGGSAATYLVARGRNLTVEDPLVRGWLAIVFKTIPQFTLAYNLWVCGAGGLAGLVVFNGHFTIFIRLGQLGFSIHEAGWDRNRIGSAISEIGNEASWIAVTVAWLAVS